MSLEKLQILYDGVSKYYELGDFDTFKSKMQDEKKRRIFYDGVSKDFDLGDYETFTSKVSLPSPALNADQFLIDPDKSIGVIRTSIYDSVRRQENSIAKNNPDGVNLPRKQSNIKKIEDAGGRVMEGSQSLLEFDSLESGTKIGEEIIDNILAKSDNDPAKFYSNYSGLPIESPEVKSFVEIFNSNITQQEPEEKITFDVLKEIAEKGSDDPQYFLTALPAVNKTKKDRPRTVMGIPISAIPGMTPITYEAGTSGVGTPILEQPGDKKVEKLTPKEIAEAQNELFFKKEIAKERGKGLSERDAYRKVVTSVGGTPPNVVDLAMDRSITGAVFRIVGMEQQMDLSNYKSNQIEDIVSGAISMIMPVDAALFKLGGGLSQLKKIGKYADEAANIISKRGNIPLKEARVYAKNALTRMTGGAGGFAVFDSGRNIVDQIEQKGEIDPLEVVESALKGLATGGTTGLLGATGSYFGNKKLGEVGGKSAEFVSEVFGLATVPALLEGEVPTRKDYIDAAGTILGIKGLKYFSPKAGTAMRETYADGMQETVNKTGRPMPEVANQYGQHIKTALQLALEGKTPEKTIREKITEYEVGITGEKPAEVKKTVEQLEKQGVKSTAEFLKQNSILSTIEGLKKQGFSQKEAEQRAKTILEDAGVKTTVETPELVLERSQLETSISELSKKINELEKANAQQKILDDLQIQIDSKVNRLNKIGVPETEINRALEAELSSTPKEIDLTRFTEKSLFRDFSQKQLLEFLKSKNVKVSKSELSKAKLIQKIKTLSKQKKPSDLELRPDVVIEKVSALKPKETLTTAEIQLQMKRRDRSERKRLEKTLQERDFFNRKFEADPMLEVPLHPADAGRKAISEIKSIEPAPDVAPQSKKVLPVRNKKLTGLDNKGNAKDHNVKIGDEVYVNSSNVSGRVTSFKQTKDTNIITIKNKKGSQELTDRNLFTPKKIYEENLNRKNLKPILSLEGQKKLEAIQLQREFSDFEANLKANQSKLKDPSLTEVQIENLKSSSQKLRELQREVQDRASSRGIELQAFMGIPSPRLLRNIFGSGRKSPKRYSDAEIDRLYKNAMNRLDKDISKEEIRIKGTYASEPVKTQTSIGSAFSALTSDMVQRVRDMGTPTSKEAYDLGRRSIDIEKQIYGQLSKPLDIVLKSSGKNIFTKEGQAVKNLQKFINVEINGNEVKLSRLHAGIEGLIKLKGAEAKIVKQMRDLIESRGRIFEENGIMQEGRDGTVKPFKVMGRKIAPRIMTGDFYRIIKKGVASPEFKKLVEEFQKSSGQSPESIREYFSELSANMSGIRTTAGELSPTRTTQAEHSRKWKNIPHAIEINGRLVPIVEYRPYEYATRLAETGSSRIGVAKTFGQELNNTSIINEIKSKILEEGGDPVKFHEMVRTLSSTPVENPIMDAGTGSQVVRGVKSSVNFIKNLTLSGSFFPNISEPLGNVRKHVGMPQLLKSIFQVTTSPTAVKSALEAKGAITVDIANLSIDPQRPISSLVRGINNIQRRGFGFHYMNEFQEVLAAQGYKNKVEKFKNNKGTSKDVLLLVEMGFSKADAKLMASGKAPQQMYDALIRRASAYLTGGAQRKGEMSRIEHSRYFNALTAFQTYAQMKQRSLVRSAKTLVEVGGMEAIKERNHKKFVDSARLALSEVLGTSISGITTQFILAGVYGGKDNVYIKWNEVQQEPLRFLMESYLYAAVGGVMGSIIQSTTDKKLGIENIYQLSYPIGLIGELVKAGSSTGKYKYLDTNEKFTEVSKRYFPLNKAVRTAKVAFGFGNEQSLKNDNAIRGYYRWKFKNKYGGRFTDNPDKELRLFRQNMKKAHDALKNGEGYEVVDSFVFKALDIEGKDDKSAISSILGKRLLTKSKIAPGKSDEVFEERLENLRKTIGEEAYRRIENHDYELKYYADTF